MIISININLSLISYLLFASISILFQSSHATSITEYGAVCNGIDDDSAAITKAINSDSVVLIPGKCAHTKTIRLPSNIHMIIPPGAELIATSKMVHQIRAKGKINISIQGGGTINSNNNVTTQTVSLVATENILIEGINIINWKTAIHVASDSDSNGKAAKNVRILSNKIDQPGDVAIYPIWVGSTRNGRVVKNVSVINNSIIGYPGAYSHDNNRTADQIVMYGVEGFLISGNKSINCGENCMTISHGSKNGIVSNNILGFGDGHGIHIGEKLNIVDNVIISNNLIHDNGLNITKDIDEQHGSLILAGIFIRHAKNISLTGNRVTGKAQQYGLYATSGMNVLIGDNVFEGVVNNVYIPTVGEGKTHLESAKRFSPISNQKLNSLEIDNSGNAILNSSYISVKVNQDKSLLTLVGGSDGMVVSIRKSGEGILTIENSDISNGFRTRSNQDIVLQTSVEVTTFRFDANLHGGSWLEM